MRDRFPLLLIGGLAMLAVLGGFVLKGARRGDFADRLSTYRSSKDGSRAVYLLLERAKVRINRNQKSLEVIDQVGNLVMLGPEFDGEFSGKPRELFSNVTPDGGVTEAEEEETADIRERGFNTLRARQVTKEETEKLLEHVRNGATLLLVPWGHAQNPLLDAVGVQLIRAPKSLELRTLVPAVPSAYTLGVERIEARVQAYLELPETAVPLLTDDPLGEVVAALVPWGQGRLIVLAAPELAMNQALARADNAQFWISMGRALGADGALSFEEFHHGFTGDRSMADFASRYGLQFAVGQLLLGVALWALSLKRFGRATVPLEEKRLGATDMLIATSRLYREGKHFQHSAMATVRELATRLAIKAGVAAKSTPAQISAGLEMRGHKSQAMALLDVSRRAASANSEADVQEVALAAAQLRYQLNQKKRASP